MDLQDHLVDCTVRVESGAGAGTGFFVAPGLVVAPAHVVESPNGGEYPLLDLTIHYRGGRYSARTIRYAASPHPDLAILQAGVPAHSSAYLYSAVREDDPLFACGYPDGSGDAERLMFNGGEIDGMRLDLESRTVREGMAGAPVLNLRTGGVCAILRNDPYGHAVATHVSVIDTLFPGIRDTHDRHHQDEPGWFEAPGGTGTVFAARAHLLAMRQACQEPIQPLLSPKSGTGAVDLMVPVRFKVLTADGVERTLPDLAGISERCGSDGPGIMIVGPSGSGRSSMLRYLGYAAALASPNLGGRQAGGLFPVMIRANQLASREGGIEQQVLDAIQGTAGPLGETPLPPTFLSDLVETPGLRLLIMIDGVDEIQNSRDFAEVVDFIGRIRNETDFGRKSRLVVTSRPSAVEHFRYSGFDVYEMQPLDRDSIEVAARCWLGDNAETFLRDNQSLVVSGIFSSPLALSIALTLYDRNGGRLSNRLVDLYGALVEAAVEDWTRQGLQRKYGAEVTANAVDVLGFLALELLRSATVQNREWVRQAATRYFIQHLKTGPDRASELAGQFTAFAAADSFFLGTAGDRLYWTHLSFQDYFAALRLTTSDDEAGNAVKAIRSRWFDASRGNAPAFAAAMLPVEAERVAIAREILRSGREERRDFLRNLIIDGAELPDDLVQGLVDDLLEKAKEERESYGTFLRPSPRTSFAFDLLLSLGHLAPAARALEAIASGEDWPSQIREKARTSALLASR